MTDEWNENENVKRRLQNNKKLNFAIKTMTNVKKNVPYFVCVFFYLLSNITF